jgi:hypothetical protein
MSINLGNRNLSASNGGRTFRFTLSFQGSDTKLCAGNGGRTFRSDMKPSARFTALAPEELFFFRRRGLQPPRKPALNRALAPEESFARRSS